MNSIFDENDDSQKAGEKRSRPPGMSSLNLSDYDGEKTESWTGHDYEPSMQPMSIAETVRGSGLAYAAGVTLVASVVFMLLLGWFIDRLAGTGPYGAVGGIILGAIIGFVQFFRLTSQIFKK